MKKIALVLFTFLANFGFVASVHAQTEFKITASDGTQYDQFGRAVDISGNFAIVGAPFDDDLATYSGSAYIFFFDGTSWVQTQKLLSSDGAYGDFFGWDVAINGNVAVVGARGDWDNGIKSGSAYVFTFSGNNWIQTQKLIPSDGQSSDDFGLSVAISGNRLVIGAPSDDPFQVDTGAAYFFEFNGSNWVEQQIVIASGAASNDKFGNDVAISGNGALIGAPRDSENGFESGSVYSYEFDGTNWLEQQKLLAADGAVQDKFGSTLALDGNQAIISAFLDDDNGSNSGSAYIFDFDGINWSQSQKLNALDAAEGDRFGTSVDLAGDLVIIGSRYDDDKGNNSGSAHLFGKSGNWIQLSKILAGDGAPLDEFGIAVAISDSVLLVGAYADNNNGSRSGSAYIYSLLTNDICADAFAIQCGDTMIGSTNSATNNDAPDSCFVNLSNAPGVWYTFTGTGDNITASLCGSDYDTKIGIFANGCSDSTRFCIAGNDDVCGLQSEVVFPTFPGIEYYIYVTGFDTLSGNFQLAFNCTPATCSIAPTSSTDQVGLTNVQISWSMVPGAVYYEILGGPLSSPQSTFTVPATQTQLLVNGLGLGVTYSWRIRAVCNLSGTSKSPYSLTQVFTTLTSCNPPDTLFTDPITSNTTRLNWSTVIGASSYNIFGNVVGNPNPIKLTINDPNTTTFDVFNLTPNTSYYWTVVSKCGADVSAIGVVDTFTTMVAAKRQSELKIENYNIENYEARIYPNPAISHLTIQLNTNDHKEPLAIIIYDLNGQRIFETNEYTMNGVINLKLPDHLTKGVYQVQVAWGERVHSEKLVLIN